MLPGVKPIRTFTVTPALPPAIEKLRLVAHDLRWTWDHEAIGLFRRLDRDLWETSGHNPVRMLGTIEQEKLEEAAADEGFRAHLERVAADFEAYRKSESTWFHRTHPKSLDCRFAYFSAEFGLTECLSIFAGGLGILAGDHLKSASDLGVPLVGVGLLYQQGYFRQYLNEAGWQQQAYEDNDFYNLPIALARRADGTPLVVEVPELGRPARAQVWRAQVGRVPLYLLDTNLPANHPDERDVTDQLYGGDPEMRIKQELILGLGGYRALEALGIEPSVYHMNEGHSAFLALERMRRLVEKHGIDFAAARELASAGLVFTTHTPVDAGHDRFPPALIEKHLAGTARALGLALPDLLALGRVHPSDAAEPFCMTVLALRLANHSNAVSRLHARTTCRMWKALWPGVPEDDIPIKHVTNGVHFRSWISAEMNQLYDRYLGPRWREEPTDRMTWQQAGRIPAEELWRTHERRRERLVACVRRRLRAQLERRGAPRQEIDRAESVLDPDALTIGFGRRMAGYKRATLLLSDTARLERLLGDPHRPVQVLFAGKAHPRDDAGKEFIRQIALMARRPEVHHRVVFLEDYDLALARYLVQGCDVWLNTPRRPYEASGTSGMKAAANGVLNVSTLDGWWDEAWRGWDVKAAPFGWAIGRGEIYADAAEQDHVEAAALYDLLESDVVPCFYERAADGVPHQWIARMRASLSVLCHTYNTHRMVREYVERTYLPAAVRGRRLRQHDLDPARELAAWRARVTAAWPELWAAVLPGELPADLHVGDVVVTQARVYLGKLAPDDVRVEMYMGRVDANDEITDAEPDLMRAVASEGGGVHLYEAKATRCRKSGLHGYTVRVLPHHAGLPTPFLPGLVTWATAAETAAGPGAGAADTA
jgi:starch phosphorylase